MLLFLEYLRTPQFLVTISYPLVVIAELVSQKDTLGDFFPTTIRLFIRKWIREKMGPQKMHEAWLFEKEMKVWNVHYSN